LQGNHIFRVDRGFVAQVRISISGAAVMWQSGKDFFKIALMCNAALQVADVMGGKDEPLNELQEVRQSTQFNEVDEFGVPPSCQASGAHDLLWRCCQPLPMLLISRFSSITLPSTASE